MKIKIGDGHALYFITSVGKTGVQVKWLDYCDQWVDDMCGYGCRMSLKQAIEFIRRQDAISKIFM